MKKDLARKSFLVTINHTIIALLGFISMFFIKKYMGYEALGMIAFATSFMTVFLIFGDLGFGVAHLKKVSEGYDLKRCNGTIITIKSVLTLFMAIMFVAVISLQKYIFGYEFESHTMEIVLYLVAINYFFLNWGHSFRNVFTAQLQMTRAQIPRIAAKFVTASLKVTLAVAGFSVLYIVYAEMVGTFVLISLWIFYFIRTQSFSKPDRDYLKLYISFALPVVFIGILNTLIESIDKVMLGYMVGSLNVGIYTVPQRITAVFLIVSASITGILFVSFSELHRKNKFSKIQAITRSAEKYISIIMLPIVIFVFIFAEEILLIFGEDTAPSVPVLKILTIALYMDAVRGPYGVQVISTGYIKLGFYVALVTLLMNIFLNYIFIPDLGFNHIYFDNVLITTGAVGAALATLISLTLRGIIAKYCAFRISNTKPSILKCSYIKSFFNHEI